MSRRKVCKDDGEWPQWSLLMVATCCALADQILSDMSSTLSLTPGQKKLLRIRSVVLHFLMYSACNDFQTFAPVKVSWNIRIVPLQLLLLRENVLRLARYIRK